MPSRALFVLTAALAAVAVLAVPAAAEKPRKGTVARSWASVGKNGKPQKRFSRASKSIYASFVWKRPPTPGQKLSITFRRPDGQAVARWTNRALRADRPGTRLFTFVPRSVFRKARGAWTAVLTVGGVPRGTVRFTVVR